MAADLNAIRAAHPEWNITSIAQAPNGGIWAVGKDGGVFALDSEGTTTGTRAPLNTDGPFSYTGLDPSQRQGSRTFTGIQASQGGYTLYSDIPGQTYAFSAPSTTGPVGGTTPPAASLGPASTPPAGDDTSGKDVFTKSLIAMGFTPEQAASLGTSLWTASKTKSQDGLYTDLISSPEYAARFPGMKALRDQGAAMPEAHYISLEGAMRDAAKSAGLPEGFFDSHDDFGTLIANGVSPTEYADRIRWAQTAALGTDPTFREELARQVPGANLGDLTAFYLDPNMGTKQLEQKQIRAQIGTSARQTGFGTLTQAEIDTLQARGVDPNKAQTGFGTLEQYSGLTSDTVGETTTDQHFTHNQQLGFVAGDVKATQELTARKARRQAGFEGGGGGSSGGQGRQGIGST